MQLQLLVLVLLLPDRSAGSQARPVTRCCCTRWPLLTNTSCRSTTLCADSAPVAPWHLSRCTSHRRCGGWRGVLTVGSLRMQQTPAGRRAGLLPGLLLVVLCRSRGTPATTAAAPACLVLLQACTSIWRVLRRLLLLQRLLRVLLGGGTGAAAGVCGCCGGSQPVLLSLQVVQHSCILCRQHGGPAGRRVIGPPQSANSDDCTLIATPTRGVLLH